MREKFILTKLAWIPWGLSIPRLEDFVLGGDKVEGWAEAERSHDLVAQYLATHPEIAARYRMDQTGEIKYGDVLTLTELSG